MNPGDLYVAMNPTGDPTDRVRIVGIDQANGGAVVFTPADSFGESYSVAPQGFSRFYNLEQAAQPASDPWESGL